MATVTLKINLKVALDLESGPAAETIEFASFEQLEKAFKPFMRIQVTKTRIFKDQVPVGAVSIQNDPEEGFGE